MIGKILKNNSIIIISVILLTLLIITGFIILIIMFFNCTYNIDKVKTGEYIETVISPNEKYDAISYYISGGSLSADAVRVEIYNKKSKENIIFILVIQSQRKL